MPTETQETLSGDPYTLPSLPAKLAVTFSCTPTDKGGTTVYRLRCTVVEAVNVDRHVFVYESIPDVPGRTHNTYRYVTIATLRHMEELPIDTATPDSGYFCRKDIMDIDMRTPTLVQEARETVLRRLRMLCDDMTAMATLRPELKVTFEFNTSEDTSSLPA